MNRMICLMLVVWATSAWSAPTKSASEPSVQAQADNWSFQTLPDDAETSAITDQSDDTTSVQAIISDRKADRDFKQHALLALSCTTVLLYLVAVALMYKLPAQLRAWQIVHLTSLALIVYGALVLALVPTTHEGLTAPIGILGALAGYLFGHSSLSTEKDAKEG